jgi:hypothetical protein
VAPIVHIVFSGAGTISESFHTILPDGSISNETDTEQVSWKTVWDLDLRTLPSSKSVTPGTYNILPSTYYPAQSSFNGTGTDGACSGSISSNPDIKPPLFVLAPPDSSGTVQIFAPPLEYTTGEPCGHDPIQGIPIAFGGQDKTTDTGAFTAKFSIHPSTWEPQTINVNLDPPYSSSSTSSDGSTTVTFNDGWSGTVTLSVPVGS